MHPVELRIVASEHRPRLPCGCRNWGRLEDADRDVLLYEFMRWADTFHRVQLLLLARSGRVAVCQVFSSQRGRGHVRTVLTELCTWADCAAVSLALTPTDQWGAELGRLRRFYVSLGFEPNKLPPPRFHVQEEMIRYPVAGRGHQD